MSSSRKKVPVIEATCILVLALAVAQTLVAQPASRLALDLDRLRADADHRRARWAEHAGTAGQGQLSCATSRAAGDSSSTTSTARSTSSTSRRRRSRPTSTSTAPAGGPACSRSSRSSATSPSASPTSHSIPTTRATACSTRIHMEDPAVAAPTRRRAPARSPASTCRATRRRRRSRRPTVGGRIDREAVLIEWKDRNPANTTFEGTARELLRLQQPAPIHPMGEMTFNPAARRGDPDWRVMYIGSGDAGTGEQKDIRRLNPQRLDTLVGKILRIVPDLREHTATSTVSENGRYRIPNDNPFTALEGARKEIWAYGLRNPHRLVWDVDPARPAQRRVLFAFNIGLTAWETVVIVKKGANYGYSLREGPQMMSPEGMSADAGRTTRFRCRSRTPSHAARSRRPTRSFSIRTWRRTAAMRSPAASSTAAARSRRSGASSCSATSRRAGSGTPSLPTCLRPTTATRRRWRRLTRSTPASAASWRRPIASAAARARRCPAPPPSRAAAAWTSGSRPTTRASSTSSRRATG